MAKKKMKKPTKQQGYISDGIIFSILYKLPVKSLLRFTCVSKSWKAMITSSDFVLIHHNHHWTIHNDNNNNENSCFHLIYLSEQRWKDSQDCTLSTRDAAYGLAQLPLSEYKIVGVCEGLICLKTKSAIYIWNPLIGTLKKAPDSSKSSINHPDDVLMGFGFTGRSGDYRVIRMTKQSDDRSNDIQMEIYSLAVDEWRKLEVCGSFRWIYWASPMFFKGCIHWVSEYDGAVLRFDVEEERFEEIQASPLSMQTDNNWMRWRRNRQVMSKLAVINGFLAFLRVKTDKDITVWPYVYKESEWFALDSVVLQKDRCKRVLATTKAGSIILDRSRDERMFAYDCCYENNDLSFKLRDLGIHRTSGKFHVMPISMGTLFLLQSMGKS